VRGEEYFRQLWDGKRNGPADRLLLNLLKPLSAPYALALRLRSAAYEAGLFRSFQLPRPVVAVGNLTVGGTGKTPMVVYLARWFMERGKRVTVLSRGYGGSLQGKVSIVADGLTIQLSPVEAGDEPYLLACSVPGLSVVIGADRYQAGLLALERLDPDIFILDDGFQHQRLKRDLNLLLLDSGKPFANGLSLPAGRLREPLSAIKRADLVIYTKYKGNISCDLTDKPWCAAYHRLTCAIPLGSGEPVQFLALKNLRALAFAGIAEPDSFFESLKAEGVCLSATLSLPDHCSYGDAEVEALCRLKVSSSADCLITTVKDAVKLSPYLDRLGTVYAAELEIEFADQRPLEKALEKLIYI
jgi:tetraacyldisaccharide 4'-kinase